MDSSAGKRHLEPLQIPTGDGPGDKRGRRYVYDASPTKPKESNYASSSTINTVSPQSSINPTIVTQVDVAIEEEQEPKISFMNFQPGSIALFVPVDASKKVWMAFHSGRPNHFLAEVRLLYKPNC
jgi:hypothetical protein